MRVAYHLSVSRFQLSHACHLFSMLFHLVILDIFASYIQFAYITARKIIWSYTVFVFQFEKVNTLLGLSCPVCVIRVELYQVKC